MSNDAPYQKECSFCKQQITMSKQSGNWLPYELNTDKKHDCRKQNHKEITLEMVKKKLESIGIVIDLDKLMNQK